LTGASASLAFTDFVGQALSATATLPLQILDVAPPTLDVSLSPNRLWPSNLQLHDVTATITVKDNCDLAPALTLVSITSNEPAVGFIGDGDKGPDFEGAAFGTDDRVTATYRVTDKSGNATEQTSTVTVPTNNSGK